MKYYHKLMRIVGKGNIKLKHNLKNITYAKLGGKADYLVMPRDEKELIKVIKFARKNDIPITIIGSGSNLIIRDGGLRGIVLSLKHLNKIRKQKSMLIIQCGLAIKDSSIFALENNLTGLEFACGIPGTIGGAIFMNAGAYGGEIKDILIHCKVIDMEGNINIKSKDELNFGYRYSSVQESNEIIIEGTFLLEEGIYEEIKARMDYLTELRNLKQPLEYPSCGSVFKRPNGYFAGKLIADSNLQGLRIGGAEVSKKHAGFIVNVNNATANEYIQIIDTIQEKVKKDFNIHLEREVKIIGED